MSADEPQLSFVVPCHNEEGNLRPLIAAIRESVEPLKISYEIVLTDDRSTDGTWQLLNEFAAADPRIRALRFARNAGQSAAMWAGMKAAPRIRSLQPQVQYHVWEPDRSSLTSKAK